MSAIVLYLTMALMVWKSSAVPNHPTGCGIRNVGGLDPVDILMLTPHQADFGEFPWTVALLNKSDHSYFGAGSLIHPKVVLTAAHKVQKRNLSDFVVRAGEWNLQTFEEHLPHEDRIPRQKIIHPLANARNLKNGFALIVLEEAFPMTDHISTVCLPPANYKEYNGRPCFSGGWGKDNAGQDGRHSVILKRVDLTVVPFDQCQQELRRTRLGRHFVLHQSFLCATALANADTCQCDGGAALVCPTGPPIQNRYHQTGIVSWGLDCNDGSPGAYANVSYGRPWIDQKMKELGFDTATYTA